jgi:hypothetical protein
MKKIYNPYRKDDDILLDSFKDFRLINLTFKYNNETKIPIITIYNNETKDYYGYFVARLFFNNKCTSYVMISKTMKQLTHHIPEHMWFIGRTDTDDKKIIGTYV